MVMVGYDGSAGSRRALQVGIGLAVESGAPVTAVIVQHHLPRYGATVGEVDEERLVEAADARRLEAEIHAYAGQQDTTVATAVVIGHPAHELVRLAKEQRADVIVVGHSQHASLRAAVLGGVAEHVARHAPCSVLVVR